MTALDLEYGDIAFQVEKWEDELAEETCSALRDMAEVEDKDIEAEAAAFTGKLLFLVTEGDWKDAEGIASVLESFFSEQAGDDVEPEDSEEETETGDEEQEEASEEQSDSPDEDEQDDEDGEGVIIK
ncbi:hypothetical protein [Haloferax sp. Q22]|uniref:hypothetical protein n=1 Tax=Haloferax sp. (strain Q22) TaxID=1526048 RepID=UPI000737CEDC|nr:hypothetical protein [Haloferax sp. Q22]